jgi:hypothetical protein
MDESPTLQDDNRLSSACVAASICTPTSLNPRTRLEQFGDYGLEEKMSIALPAVRTQTGGALPVESNFTLKIDAVRTSDS